MNFMKVHIDSQTKTVTAGEKSFRYEALRSASGEVTAVLLNGKRVPLQKQEQFTAQKKNEIHAPLHGQITKILIANESEAREGDVILSLEAMKMENEIRAPISGRIKEFFLKEKDNVKAGQLLLKIEPK